MKYILLVHVPKETLDGSRHPEAAAAGRAYGQALQEAGIFVAGAGLGSPDHAALVSVRDGKRQVHDGPYAETKEFLGGFVILEVPDRETAVEWAARHPAAATGCVEVQPVGGAYFSPRAGATS